MRPNTYQYTPLRHFHRYAAFTEGVRQSHTLVRGINSSEPFLWPMRSVTRAMAASETPARSEDALTLHEVVAKTGANIEIVTDDPRILAIARAIGRQIALEALKAASVENDNEQTKTS